MAAFSIAGCGVGLDELRKVAAVGQRVADLVLVGP
jgi:hypothetical protein